MVYTQGSWYLVLTSVADPDPDPVRSGIFGSPGSGTNTDSDPDP